MALIISLGLLLVMSLLGVAGMQAAVMEQNMSSNAQQHMETFQAAESGLESTSASLADVDVLGAALSAGTSGVNHSHDASAPSYHHSVSTTTNLLFLGETLGSGASLTKVSTLHFRLRASATLGAGSAQSRHTADVYKLGPKL
jgi:type IV pilus assembly protein PilX